MCRRHKSRVIPYRHERRRSRDLRYAGLHQYRNIYGELYDRDTIHIYDPEVQVFEEWLIVFEVVVLLYMFCETINDGYQPERLPNLKI